MKVEERYKHDPVFHGLVDMIRGAIHQKAYTPTEVREAAMLASLMYEQENPNVIIKGYDHLHDALNSKGE